MKMTRALTVILLAIVAGLCAGCFPKGYTAAEEKDQLAHAIALARIYQEKYAPNARLKESTFHVYDAMREGEHDLKLTDWVYGKYLDGGEYNMYINTNANKIYSDKEWTSVESYGRRIAGDLYGLDENEMTVDVLGSTKLPFRADDAAFGMITLSNMIPATDAVNYEYKGMENMAHGGYFDPALVYVTTDKEGRIVGMSKLDYAVDGAYYDTGEMVFWQ